MRADLSFTRAEIAWRATHGVSTTERRMLNRRARRLLARAFGTIPSGPHGFDVSSYQPAAPDFRQGDRSFAIFKAAEGLSYRDPHFAANRAAAHAQGCTAVGMYYFARPGSTDPVAAANYLLATVGPRRTGEFLILDFEVPPWSQAWIVAFIRTLQAAGWNVAFYTYAGMAAANPTDQVRAITPYYWPAGYGSNPPSADRWADIGWTLWQHTDGSVGSVDGPWDCSVANAVLLAQLAGSATPPLPPQPPAPPKPKFISEEESMFYEATRRVKADGTPQPWTSDHGGSAHPYVYDIDANEDGHNLGTVKVVSWLWIRAANADEAAALAVKTGHGPRVSIWSQGKGRWVDGEVNPSASDPAGGGITSDDRGWPVPTAGAHAVVSIDDIPLKVSVERNVIPV